jgi:hypothetical protein
MGFNIQQYETQDNYSNAVGWGCGLIINKQKKAKCEEARTVRRIRKSTFSLKSFFGIGDGVVFGKVVNPRKKLVSDFVKKAELREAIAESKQPKDSWINIDGETKANVVTAPKSNNKLYIGIGVIAVGIIGFLLIRKK